MAMTGPYIPRPDGAFREWLNNFARVIARAPWAVALTPADAEKLVALADRYELAYVRAISPDSRRRTSVATKNAVRREAWDTVRPIAMLIKRNAGIDDAQKITLGVFPPRNSQSPIPRPRTAPELTIVNIAPGVHRLRFCNPASPSRYAKPLNVTQLQLRIAVGREPARSWREAGRVHIATRHVFNVSFDAKDSGKIATYFGRWVTERGRAGPWSRPLSVTIA